MDNSDLAGPPYRTSGYIGSYPKEDMPSMRAATHDESAETWQDLNQNWLAETTTVIDIFVTTRLTAHYDEGAAAAGRVCGGRAAHPVAYQQCRAELDRAG